MPNVRIRYSLLTLLVLTALIAGGVKLWYGPHRVVISNPPTLEEQEILNSHPLINGFFRIPSARLEYGYYSSWNAKQVKYLLARWDLLQTLAFLHADEGQAIRKLSDYTPSQRYLALKSTSPEHILILIDMARVPTDPPFEFYVYAPAKEQTQALKTLFLLSSHRRIYRLIYWNHDYWPAEEIALDSIPDMATRDLISSELGKIPENLQRPYKIKPANVLEEAAVSTAIFVERYARIYGTE